MRTMGAAVSFTLLFAVSAFACDPQLDLASVSLTSRGVWRGIEIGSGRYANAHLAWALCGPRAAEKSKNGFELAFDAQAPVTGNGIDIASASLRYLRFFGEENSSWFGAGYTQYHWGNTAEEWSGEVFAEVYYKLNVEEQGLTFWPYAEIAYDFQEYEGTYARVGIQHILPPNPFRIAATIDTSVSGSNYTGTFDFHAAEASLWVDWTVRPSSTFEIGAGGGWVWASNSVGDDGPWVGVRARIR